MEHYEFSAPDPNAKMKIVTKQERIQPTLAGVDEKGRMIWEGRAMARWQMLLLPLRYMGDFIGHWVKRANEEKTGLQTDAPSMVLHSKKIERRSYKKYNGD